MIDLLHTLVYVVERRDVLCLSRLRVARVRGHRPATFTSCFMLFDRMVIGWLVCRASCEYETASVVSFLFSLDMHGGGVVATEPAPASPLSRPLLLSLAILDLGSWILAYRFSLICPLFVPARLDNMDLDA